jgi:uncharacterized BrkB/YihY/UPF0761 family membrane protein
MIPSVDDSINQKHQHDINDHGVLQQKTDKIVLPLLLLLPLLLPLLLLLLLPLLLPLLLLLLPLLLPLLLLLLLLPGEPCPGRGSLLQAALRGVMVYC